MKKIIIMLVIVMMFFIPDVKSNASAIFTNVSVSTNVSDIIVPKHDFMVWTSPKTDDFEIIGDLNYDGQIYKVEDVTFGIGDYFIRDMTYNEVTIYISVKNTDIKFMQKMCINIIPFNPDLKCNIENQTININEVRWKSEDGFDVINYFDDLNVRMETITHAWVWGDLKFSDNYYNPQIGYNDVTYRFIPSDDKFNTTYGKFTVFYDKKPTIKQYTDHLIINGLNREHYDIYANGKKYKTTYINNLKSKTSYKIEIYQKATDTRKKTLLYTFNVKTK